LSLIFGFQFYYCRMLSMINQPNHSFSRRTMLLLSAQIPLTFSRYNKHIEFLCDLMNDSVTVVINIIFILSMEILSLFVTKILPVIIHANNATLQRLISASHTLLHGYILLLLCTNSIHRFTFIPSHHIGTYPA